ncbi:hypothetical protein [Cyclonatronum proteinivorum]|nr:hypothetical protein [Cyclonatronum proteinivorum]
MLLLSMMLFLLAPVGEAAAGFWGGECPVELARKNTAAATQMSCCPSDNQERLQPQHTVQNGSVFDGYQAFIPTQNGMGCDTAAASTSCCAACDCWIDASDAAAAAIPAVVPRTGFEKLQLEAQVKLHVSFFLNFVAKVTRSEAVNERLQHADSNQKPSLAAALPLRVAYCCYLI